MDYKIFNKMTLESQCIDERGLSKVFSPSNLGILYNKTDNNEKYENEYFVVETNNC